MDASLDTNVIIHFYNAGLQSILLNRFEKLVVYEYIRSHELERHASSETKNKFDQDVDVGKIELVTDSYIRNIGMYSIFEKHIQDIKILFNIEDLGETYAIALALTLGCISLITDDIKERGPYYTLMRLPDSDVIPFAFYEVLFLDYLEGKITNEEVLDYFITICHFSGMTIDLLSKLKVFIKRFWSNPYRESEKEWMICFCNTRNIDAKFKVQNLYEYLKEN